MRHFTRSQKLVLRPSLLSCLCLLLLSTTECLAFTNPPSGTTTSLRYGSLLIRDPDGGRIRPNYLVLLRDSRDANGEDGYSNDSNPSQRGVTDDNIASAASNIEDKPDSLPARQEVQNAEGKLTGGSFKKEKPKDIRTEDLMAAMGTNPRRIFLSLVSGTGIALAGNFLGITSKLLTLVPESTVEATGLDTYFPRGDFKRVKGRGYTFIIPKEWVGDTFVELAKAQRQTRPLDLDMNRRMVGPTTLPDSAFGPPGRLNPRTGVSDQGDTNVSVIVSGGLASFSLKGTLGSPAKAAETFLRVSLAPEGSGRTATLLGAEEDPDRQVYQFQYDVYRGTTLQPLRAISVIAAGKPAGSTLLTMTVTAPKETWERNPQFADKLEKVARSFHVT